MAKTTKKRIFHFFGIILFTVVSILLINSFDIGKTTYMSVANGIKEMSTLDTPEGEVIPVWPAVLDKEEYDKRLLALANYVPPKPSIATTTADDGTVATTTITGVVPVYATSTSVSVPGKRWPTSAAYPNGDAILPFNRILAYYGNFYSTKMGILGEYEPDEVLHRLASTTEKWEAADPTTPVVPAVEYIAMVAQGSAGNDGMYRAVMPDSEIDKAHALAEKAKGILILDLQVGLSTVEQELPKFKKYMMLPDTHLALDPEFSMKGGQRPSTVIGTMSAHDINYTINYLSEIVRENKLPPKVLLVHRFTGNMVTNADQIKPTPEVQVVMVMDGWGSKDLKRGTYKAVIEPEPVQFTGIKLFYKNDLKFPSTGLLTPLEVLALNPKPIFIQYQ